MKLRNIAANLALITFSVPAAQAADTPTTPQEANEQFTQAVGLRDGGNVGQSIRNLQAMLDEQPGLDRIRLELAVAYYRALNFSKARELAQEVLNKPSTPESVRVTIRQFLAQIEKDSEPSVFTPFLSAGYIYDSNVNAGPGRSVLDIGGTQFTLDDASSKRSDSGLNALVGVNHRYLFDGTVNIAGSDAAALWQSQLSYYNMSYESLSDYNLDVISLSTGPVLISADNWSFALPYQASDIYLGHEHLALFQALNPTVTYRFGAWEMGVDYQYQDKSFLRDDDEGRDSKLKSVGLSLGRSFADGRYSAAVTVRDFRESADLSRYSNDGYDYGVILAARPWDGWEFSLRHNYRTSDYKGEEPVYGEARDDREYRSAFGANYTFSSGMMENWMVGLTITETRNHSNISLYDYNRTQAGLNLSRSF